MAVNEMPRQRIAFVEALFSGHCFQRVLKLRSTLTAHAICLALDREDTAQMRVVTAEDEVNGRCEYVH